MSEQRARPTRIVVISDTHLGHAGSGFQVNPTAPDVLEGMLVRVAALKPNALIHCGDAVHKGSPDETSRFIDMLSKTVWANGPIPVSLCLGNHDLTDDHCLARWSDIAGAHEALSVGDAAIDVGDRGPVVRIVSVRTRWADALSDAKDWWQLGSYPVPMLDDSAVQAAVDRAAGFEGPVLLNIHAPAMAVPPDLAARMVREARRPYADLEPLAQRLLNYNAAVKKICDTAPNIRALFAGHVHFGASFAVNHTPYFSAEDGSAGAIQCVMPPLTEHPFTVRVVDAQDDGTLEIRSLSLATLNDAPEWLV